MIDPVMLVIVIVFLVAVSVFNWLGYSHQMFALQIGSLCMMFAGIVLTTELLETALPIVALFAIENAIVFFMGAVR